MNREPTDYKLYTSLDDNNNPTWTLHGVYSFYELAVKDIQALIQTSRVKIEYNYPNGIVEFRVIEGGPRVSTRSVTTTPAPGETPAQAPPPPEAPPPPPPPPPPPVLPRLDFSVATNSMYKTLF